MAISVGNRLPEAMLLKIGANGPEKVKLGDRLAGRKVVIFGLPGAFTPTCDSAHLPGFMRTRDAICEKRVAEIICVSVNDPHVMKAWGEATGATKAGLTLLADPESLFTTAIGMKYDAPDAGLIARSRRYAMLVENGVVTVLHEEVARGVCDVSSGEAMLAVL